MLAPQWGLALFYMLASPGLGAALLSRGGLLAPAEQRRAGNRRRQAALLMNLGVAWGWQGRWDDALSCFQRSREESEKIGSAVEAEQARMNYAEIRRNQGALVEAEA